MSMRATNLDYAYRGSRGFSLVELMVAMALSLVLLAGVLAIFASSRKTYETTDRLSRIQESGRFALDMIVRDLRSAGFIGCSRRAAFTNALANATNPMWNFQFAVEGFDGKGGDEWEPDFNNDESGGDAPLADSDNDILVIRGPRGEFEPVRVTGGMNDTTETVSVVTPNQLEVGDIVQISDCNARGVFQITSNSAGVVQHSDASAEVPGNATLDIGYAYTNAAELVPLQSSIYFLRDSANGTGLALWRRVSGSDNAEELVEGIEAMQVDFGEQVGNAIEYRDADEVDEWANVVSVRVALLVRSLSEYGTDRGPDSYTLLDDVEVANPGDRHMRQVFTTTVSVRNLGV